MKTSIKTISILFIFIISAVHVSSQDSAVYRKNGIKLNLVSLGIKSYSVMYERNLTSHNTVSLGVSYHPASAPPVFFMIRGKGFEVTENELIGFTITPEYRHYLIKCSESKLSSGFYIGGYGRYLYFELNATIEDRLPGYNVTAYFNADLTEIGLGLQLGYQIVYKKRWLLDFMAFGPRVSWYYYTMGIEINGESDLPEKIEDFINEKFGDISIDEKVKFQSGKKYTSSFNFANFRYGLAVGYRF